MEEKWKSDNAKMSSEALQNQYFSSVLLYLGFRIAPPLSHFSVATIKVYTLNTGKSRHFLVGGGPDPPRRSATAFCCAVVTPRISVIAD